MNGVRLRRMMLAVVASLLGAAASAQTQDAIPMAKPGPPATVTSEPSPLRKPSAPITLQGRDGKIEVRNKNGTVEDLDASQLRLLNRTKPEATKPAASSQAKPAMKDKPDQQAEDAEKEKAEAEKAEREREAREKAEATKKSDIARLRSLEGEGAWFYDGQGKPISQEDLDKRIDAGKVADIKTVDIHLQEWKTESKAAKKAD